MGAFARGELTAPKKTDDLGGDERYLPHLATDKPLYRPGERVFARAVFLDAFRRVPLDAEEPVGFRVTSARGEEVAHVLSTAADGVAEFGWRVPAGTPGGTYTLAAD